MSNQWMDGWESRRRRTPGFDWCVLHLGAAERVRGVDVDTRCFAADDTDALTVLMSMELGDRHHQRALTT
jgi:allantoicase